MLVQKYFFFPLVERERRKHEKCVSRTLFFLFIINLVLQLEHQSVQLLWSQHFSLNGSFWVSAAGVASFICFTVKSINTRSNHSVGRCYRPHLLRDCALEQTQRRDRLCWRGGCALCHDNYMYQGWLPVREASTFTSNMRVWKWYSRMQSRTCTAPKKKAVNADEDKGGALGWPISIKFSRKFSVRLWLDGSITFAFLTLNHFCSFCCLNGVVLVEHISVELPLTDYPELISSCCLPLPPGPLRPLRSLGLADKNQRAQEWCNHHESEKYQLSSPLSS